VKSDKKDVVVILNGISLYKKAFYHKYFTRLSKLCNLQVRETKTRNDAAMLASKAAENYVDVVIAAGGDGTLHQVINGVLTGRENETKLPVIALIPIGSGNDFARTAGIKQDIDQLENLLKAFRPRQINVGRVHFSDDTHENANRYFINEVDIGMGPYVVEKVVTGGRPFGAAVSYYQSILSTFLTYKPMLVRAEAESWKWEGKVRTLAVANGKYYGHGLCVAPDAQIDDGKFSVFICADVSVLTFIRHSSTLKKGKHVRIPKIHYKDAIRIQLSSDQPCLIEADGEILGRLPATVEMVERKVEFLM
jgi:diacylglycerol kinase (ATP)